MSVTFRLQAVIDWHIFTHLTLKCISVGELRHEGWPILNVNVQNNFLLHLKHVRSAFLTVSIREQVAHQIQKVLFSQKENLFYEKLRGVSHRQGENVDFITCQRVWATAGALIGEACGCTLNNNRARLLQARWWCYCYRSTNRDPAGFQLFCYNQVWPLSGRNWLFPD